MTRRKRKKKKKKKKQKARGAGCAAGTGGPGALEAGPGGMAGEVVHLWSAPRCCSTSLMYSFAQRADVAAVLDEPLYPAWLRAHPEAERPVSAETLPASVGSSRVADR